MPQFNPQQIRAITVETDAGSRTLRVQNVDIRQPLDFWNGKITSESVTGNLRTGLRGQQTIFTISYDSTVEHAAWKALFDELIEHFATNSNDYCTISFDSSVFESRVVLTDRSIKSIIYTKTIGLLDPVLEFKLQTPNLFQPVLLTYSEDVNIGEIATAEVVGPELLEYTEDVTLAEIASTNVIIPDRLDYSEDADIAEIFTSQIVAPDLKDFQEDATIAEIFSAVLDTADVISPSYIDQAVVAEIFSYNFIAVSQLNYQDNIFPDEIFSFTLDIAQVFSQSHIENVNVGEIFSTDITLTESLDFVDADIIASEIFTFQLDPYEEYIKNFNEFAFVGEIFSTDLSIVVEKDFADTFNVGDIFSTVYTPTTAPPQNFEANFVFGGDVLLQWDDPTTGNPDFYEIQKLDGPNWNLLATPPGTSNSIIDGDTTTGQIYNYRIRAHVGGVPSDWVFTATGFS